MKQPTRLIQETLDNLPAYPHYDLGGNFTERFQTITAEHDNRNIVTGTYIPDASCTYEDFDGQQRPYQACYLETPGGGDRTAYIKLGVHGNEQAGYLTADGFVRAALRNPHMLRELGYDRAVLFDANPQQVNTWISHTDPSLYDYLEGVWRGEGAIDHDYPVNYKRANHETNLPPTKASKQIIDEHVPLVVMPAHNSTIGAGGLYVSDSSDALTTNLGQLMQQTLPDVMPYGTPDLPMAELFDGRVPGVFRFPIYEGKYDYIERRYPAEQILDQIADGADSITYAKVVAERVGRRSVGLVTEIPYFALSKDYYGKQLIPDNQQLLTTLWAESLRDLNRTIEFQESKIAGHLEEFSPAQRLLARYSIKGAKTYQLFATSHYEKIMADSEPRDQTAVTMQTLMACFYSKVPIGSTARLATELQLDGHDELNADLKHAANKARELLHPTYIKPHRLTRVQLGALLHTMQATTA